MTTFLRRTAAASAAGAVAIAGAMVMITSGVAHAADERFAGTLNGKNGTATVAKAGVDVALCTVDCLRTGVKVTTATTAANGAFTGGTVPAGSYVVAVDDVDTIPGFTATAGRGYLRRESGNVWSLVQTFAAATRVTDVSQTFTLANAIHNPKDQFTQTTVGSGSYLPCAGRVTTVAVSPFSDAPAGTTVRYQWAAGRNAATRVVIPGATSRSYKPAASLTGLQLYMELIASAPGRTSYDRLAPIGRVGNPLNCAASRAAIPKRFIASYGVKRGKAKVGKRVSVAGAKVRKAPRKKYGLAVSYAWKVGGTTVGTARTFRIPGSAKGKKLTVTVSVKAAGFKPRAKVLRFGRVR